MSFSKSTWLNIVFLHDGTTSKSGFGFLYARGVHGRISPPVFADVGRVMDIEIKCTSWVTFLSEDISTLVLTPSFK